MFKKYKNIIIGAVVVILAFIGYVMFFAKSDTPLLSSESIDPSQTAVEQELIALLLELRSINLDTSIFENQKFNSLKDFSQELVPEAVGRTNPFAPLQ